MRSSSAQNSDSIEKQGHACANADMALNDIKTGLLRSVVMAGVERIELPSTVLETVVLPLYYTPLFQRINNSTIKSGFVNKKIEEFHENGKRSLSKPGKRCYDYDVNQLKE